jgi:hypothetical protein
MAKFYGLPAKDIARIRDAVKDFETRPARRPVAPPGASATGSSRVLVAVPRAEEDEDGYCLGDLYIHDTTDNSFEKISDDSALIAKLPDTL